jgi:hypothetical protein
MVFLEGRLRSGDIVALRSKDITLEIETQSSIQGRCIKLSFAGEVGEDSVGRFVPTASGTYLVCRSIIVGFYFDNNIFILEQVSVKLNLMEHIYGSPFLFSVEAAELDALSSMAEGAGLKSVKSNVPASFTVFPKDKYGNLLNNISLEVLIDGEKVTGSKFPSSLVSFSSSPKIDGSVEFKYTPRIPQDYVFEIMLVTPEGKVPIYESPFYVVVDPDIINSISVSGGVQWVILSVSIVTFCLTGVYSYGLYYWRQKNIMIYTQYKLIFVALFAVFLGHLSIFLRIPWPTKSLCVVINWIDTISSSILLATLYSNIWRVHRLVSMKSFSKIRITYNEILF